jgi:hypothetical protein
MANVRDAHEGGEDPLHQEVRGYEDESATMTATYSNPSLPFPSLPFPSLRSTRRRIFVRRVQFIVKAWREWARRKGKKKRVADAHWFKKGRELGFDRWHSWSVETARLKKYFNMIRVKRVARILRIRFAEWHRKIIVNRRLLRRVFQIGIEFSEHFKRLRGNREKSEFNLLRDILMAWRKTALERIRDRTLRMNLISRRMLWEASLVSRTFLGWQRYSYCAVVSREFRAEGEIRNLRRIFAGWERWSYRILRVRHKWTVRKPLEWVFCGLRLGCDVSRMSRLVWGGRWAKGEEEAVLLL